MWRTPPDKTKGTFVVQNTHRCMTCQAAFMYKVEGLKTEGIKGKSHDMPHHRVQVPFTRSSTVSWKHECPTFHDMCW